MTLHLIELVTLPAFIERCYNTFKTRWPLAGAFVFGLRADTLHAITHGDSVMGKGDKRTKRGKIFRGSYGKTRLHKKGGKSKATKKASA